MRLTGRKVLFTILSIFFTAVVPLALIIWQYSSLGEEGVSFKIGITGILLALIVFLVLKKLFFNRWTENMRAQINTYKADIRVKTDKEELANLESQLRRLQVLDTALSAIAPFILFLAVIVACRAMEAGIIKLANVMTLITVSYVGGVVFDICSALEVHAKNKG